MQTADDLSVIIPYFCLFLFETYKPCKEKIDGPNINVFTQEFVFLNVMNTINQLTTALFREYEFSISLDSS